MPCWMAAALEGSVGFDIAAIGWNLGAVDSCTSEWLTASVVPEDHDAYFGLRPSCCRIEGV